MAKCKYCGEELKEAYEDHYYLYYYCSCEGQKKASKIKMEIRNLKLELSKKEKELEELLDNGAYGKMIAKKRSIDSKINKFEDADYKA